MTNIIEDIKLFFSKYSTLTHLLLALWNVFMATWATKTSITFYGFIISADTTVGWLQSHWHLPTWAIGTLTLVLNAVMLYRNFKSSQGKLMEAKETLNLR